MPPALDEAAVLFALDQQIADPGGERLQVDVGERAEVEHDGPP